MLRGFLVIAVFCTAALAQKKPGDKPEPVNIDFTVTGPDGEFVPGLTAKDFVVSQEGKPLKVVTLRAVPTPAARAMVVVVDDLGLSLEGLHAVQRALRKFVNEVQPGDQVSFIRTGVQTGYVQSFTPDRDKLAAAIDAMNYNHLRDVGAKPTDAFHSGTLLQLRFTMDALTRSPARRAVVLLSERFTASSGTGTKTLEAIESAASRVSDFANQAMAVFYAIPVQAAAASTPLPAARTLTGLAALVKDTGGLWIDTPHDLSSALSRVLADQSHHYSVTFEPAASTFDYSLGRETSSRFEGIVVTTSRAGVQVRARNMVYAQSDDERPTGFPTAEEPSDGSNASSPVDGGAVTVRATPLFYYSVNDGAFIDVLVHIDARQLTFTRSVNGMFNSAASISSMAFDASGQTSGEVSRSVVYSLPQDTHKSVLTQGFLYSQRIPIRRLGAVQVRTAVKDEATGKVGSSGEYMEIPDVKAGEFAMSGMMIRPAAGAGEQPVEIRERAAVRSFGPGARVTYSYQIYNLSSDTQKKSHVELTVRLFRAGTQIYTSAPSRVSLDYSPQKAHTVTGTVGLNQTMLPGRYVLHITTTDLVSEKPRSVSKWIDLEVRP